MPYLYKNRWKGQITLTIKGKKTKKTKLFEDSTKASFNKAAIWENETRKAMESVREQKTSTNLKTNTECSESEATIGMWVDQYLDSCKSRKLAKDTFDEKFRCFKTFTQGLDPSMLIRDIDAPMAYKFLQSQNDDRSGYAANKDRKNLSTAWNWGYHFMEGFPKEKDIVNPFKAVPKWKANKMPRYVPPKEDFWAVYDACAGNQQDQTMLLTFINLGARRNEVFRLRWSEVDFDHNQIMLWTRKRQGGNLESDWMLMTDELCEALWSWREVRKTLPTLESGPCVCEFVKRKVCFTSLWQTVYSSSTFYDARL